MIVIKTVRCGVAGVKIQFYGWYAAVAEKKSRLFATGSPVLSIY